jgi:phage-related protein
MAGQSRTLKLSILADVDQLKKSLAQANGDVDNSSSKMGEFSKKAGLAFAAAGAAAGAYAIKLAVDGVKAAIEDEAAQIRLSTALKNATGATNEMIASVEKQILKTSLATGVADDQLRPALQRLSLSTNDVTKAQDLLNLALDISQATGKGLDSVANALGKAYDGNTAALGKLGIGLSTAELKAMSFEETQTRLSDLFGGAAAANAKTFAGRLEILKVTLDEAKESVGAQLLPIIQRLVEFVVNEVVPALGKFADFFKPITDAIDNNKEAFTEFIGFIQKYVVPVLVTVLGGAFKVVGEIAGGIINVIGAVISGLNALISGAVAGINALIRVYNSIPFLPNVSQISAPSISVPSVTIPKGTTPSVTVPKIVVPNVSGGSGSSSGGSTSGGGVSSAAMGAVMAGGAFTDSQNAARLAAQGAGGFTDSQNAARINLTVNGAIDAEGTARTIIKALNDSFYRGTGGASALQAI